MRSSYSQSTVQPFQRKRRASVQLHPEKPSPPCAAAAPALRAAFRLLATPLHRDLPPNSDTSSRTETDADMWSIFRDPRHTPRWKGVHKALTHLRHTVHPVFPCLRSQSSALHPLQQKRRSSAFADIIKERIIAAALYRIGDPLVPKFRKEKSV